MWVLYEFPTQPARRGARFAAFRSPTDQPAWSRRHSTNESLDGHGTATDSQPTPLQVSATKTSDRISH